MAIYWLLVLTSSHAKGKSAVAAAVYRSADDPAWVKNREELWSKIEAADIFITRNIGKHGLDLKNNLELD
jgi:hypothetical protein